MKRFIIALAGVALLVGTSGTAQGTVILFCRDVGNWTAEVSYDASSEEQLVRAFTLDITVDGPATIDSITDFIRGESTAANPGYGIFPGTFGYITIDPITGEATGWDDPRYTPVVDPSELGTRGGLGTNGITVALGSIYDSRADAPLPAGTLFRIGINPHGALEVNVDIALNVIRGGIVMEDNTSPQVDLRGCTLVPEPASAVILGLGGFFLVLRRRRRQD